MDDSGDPGQRNDAPPRGLKRHVAGPLLAAILAGRGLPRWDDRGHQQPPWRVASTAPRQERHHRRRFE